MCSPEKLKALRNHTNKPSAYRLPPKLTLATGILETDGRREELAAELGF